MTSKVVIPDRIVFGYSCPACNAEFTRKADAIKHMKKCEYMGYLEK